MKECRCGLLPSQGGQRRTCDAVVEEACARREGRVSGKGSEQSKQPHQRCECEDRKVRCAKAGMHLGKYRRKISTLGEGKRDSRRSQYVSAQVAIDREESADG